MKAWVTPALLGVVAVLLAINWLSRFGSAGSGDAPGSGPGWSVACGGGLCVALDGAGNSYWGLREDSAADGAFRWYLAGNVRKAQPFGVTACRERIERFERDRETLEARLAKLANAPAASSGGEDAMETARKNMLAKLERLDTQKSLDKLTAEQGPAADECRKLIGLTR